MQPAGSGSGTEGIEHSCRILVGDPPAPCFPLNVKITQVIACPGSLLDPLTYKTGQKVIIHPWLQNNLLPSLCWLCLPPGQDKEQASYTHGSSLAVWVRYTWKYRVLSG